jgi:hypothetical protein
MDTVRALRQVIMFKDVPEPVLKIVAGTAEEVSVPAGEEIIVDTGDYYLSWRDGGIEAIERGTTESGWGSSGVLGRPVVKAFNNMTAQSLAEGTRSKGAKKGIALPVAGDDARAKSIVIALLDDLGFDGVDAGGLDESWRQQPGTAVFGHPDCRQSIGALRDAARYGNPRAVEGRRPETPGTIHDGARRRGRIMSRLRSVAFALAGRFRPRGFRWIPAHRADVRMRLRRAATIDARCSSPGSRSAARLVDHSPGGRVDGAWPGSPRSAGICGAPAPRAQVWSSNAGLRACLQGLKSNEARMRSGEASCKNDAYPTSL